VAGIFFLGLFVGIAGGCAGVYAYAKRHGTLPGMTSIGMMYDQLSSDSLYAPPEL
jgi:hypothetical protein